MLSQSAAGPLGDLRVDGHRVEGGEVVGGLAGLLLLPAPPHHLPLELHAVPIQLLRLQFRALKLNAAKSRFIIKDYVDICRSNITCALLLSVKQ